MNLKSKLCRCLFLSVMLVLCHSVNAQRLSEASPGLEKNLKQVIKLFQEKKFKRSILLLRKMQKAYGKQPLITFNLGVAWANLDKPDRAVFYLKDVLNSGSSLKVASEVYLAKIYLKQNKYSEGLKFADQALSYKDLPDSLYNQLIDEVDKIANLEPKYFEAGEIQFEKGNYERAFLYFRFAWILNPTDTSVFMQSYSLIKMKKFEKAEQEIEAIRDIELYEKAYNLLDSAQQEVDRQVRASQTQRFTAYLDYSEGHNSNPNTEGKSSDEEIEADTEVTTLLGASYIFSNTVSRNMAFSTDYYYTQMKDDRFSRSTGLSFGLPFNWKPSDTFSWNITPQYERTTYADEDYIANSTASTTIDFYWGNLLFTTSASYLDYSELQSDYSYLGGYGTTASLTLAYYFTFSDISITASIGNDNLEDTDDSVGSNINTGMTLALGISFSDRHYLSNSITVTSSTYDEDADGFSRQDETTTITSTLTYTVDAYLPTIYGKINIIQNTSTLDGDDDTDDYNYDQTTISLGTSYYF